MSHAENLPQRIRILSLDVNITTIQSVSSIIQRWTSKQEGKSVCVANVHMCMEAFDDEEFRNIVNNSDLVVPDGRPLVWAQRLLGFETAGHVRGENLTLEICRLAEAKSLRIGLFGGSEMVQENLVRSLYSRFPLLKIAYAYSPPFRPLTDRETAKIRDDICSTNVEILFVGLGCPKQERWMADNRPFLSSIMLGVGAAFDFIAGARISAPRWVQLAGLEWLMRLAIEPKRLWLRYCKHNPRFLWHFARQVLHQGARSSTRSKRKNRNM